VVAISLYFISSTSQSRMTSSNGGGSASMAACSAARSANWNRFISGVCRSMAASGYCAGPDSLLSLNSSSRATVRLAANPAREVR
jgi:hypothetical protein